jgi:hypothetical protein
LPLRFKNVVQPKLYALLATRSIPPNPAGGEFLEEHPDDSRVEVNLALAKFGREHHERFAVGA